MSAQQLRKMQAGKARAKARRDRERLPRLAAYRAWLKDDNAYYARKNAGLTGGELGAKPHMPALPTHDDYVYEREQLGLATTDLED